MKNYFERFKIITKEDWIIIGFMAAAFFLGLYFSIAYSIKLSKGLTLFGDSTLGYQSGVVETAGPTEADITVLSLYWVLTAIVFLILVFFVFFKKPKTTNVIKKDIVDGRTVVLTGEEKKEETENKHDNN